jgi:hypothetical protein
LIGVLVSLTLISGLPPVCAAIRAEISKSPSNVALILEAYRDRKEGRRNGGLKDHLVDCESCLNWLGTQVEERFLIRAKKAAEYCCSSMYVAVEETKSGKDEIKGTGKEQVRFSLWRGEDPRWTIGSRGCVITHCPWCGNRLPCKPFDPAEVKRTVGV